MLALGSPSVSYTSVILTQLMLRDLRLALARRRNSPDGELVLVRRNAPMLGKLRVASSEKRKPQGESQS